MIKLRKGYEIVYFEKLTDYYVAVVDDGENQTEFTDKSVFQLKSRLTTLLGIKDL